MPWSPDYLEDGEPVNASDINARLLDAQVALNGIDRSNVRRGAFNWDMVPRPSTYGPYGIGNESPDHRYTDTIYGAQIAYATFGANNTTDRVVVGDALHGGTSSTPEATLDINGSTGVLLGEAVFRVSAILVMFNVNVQRFVRNGVSNLAAMFCIQYKSSGSATWFTLPHSERFVSHDDHMQTPTAVEAIDIDVPIAALITPDILTGDGLNVPTHTVTDVRACVSILNSAAGVEVRLDRWYLSATPINAEPG
jgi:hypothetical protein